MPLDEKARLKLDKVFMAFGSQMHALERNIRGEDWQDYREEAWQWSIIKVSALVDELYGDEKAGPLPPPPQPAVKVSDRLSETDTITVTAFAVQSQGQRKNGVPWTRYQVKDDHGINYYTFHASYQLGESYVIDWEWQGEGDRKYRFIPDKARPVTTKTAGDSPIDDETPF